MVLWYVTFLWMQCCVDICVHVRFIFHALVCEVMRDVLPSLPLKCDIMFMITCMFISACMFIITSCPHLNCHFLMNKLSLPMAVDYTWNIHCRDVPPSWGAKWSNAPTPNSSTLRSATMRTAFFGRWGHWRAHKKLAFGECPNKGWWCLLIDINSISFTA